MLVALQFIESLVQKYGSHYEYSDVGTLYPETCIALTKALSAFSIRENIIERVNQYLKDRIENFMITIHVLGNEIVIWIISTIGYTSLFQCTTIQKIKIQNRIMR